MYSNLAMSIKGWRMKYRRVANRTNNYIPHFVDFTYMVACTCKNFFKRRIELKHNEQRSRESKTANITNKHPVATALNYGTVMATGKAKQEFPFTGVSKAFKTTTKLFIKCEDEK